MASKAMASKMVVMAMFFLLWRVRCTNKQEGGEERGGEGVLRGENTGFTIDRKSGSMRNKQGEGEAQGEGGNLLVGERTYTSRKSSFTHHKQEEGGGRGGGRGSVGENLSRKSGGPTRVPTRDRRGGLLLEESRTSASSGNSSFTGNATKSSALFSFPALFVFGDSLADVGNNNFIISLAKANVRPFGIDFPSGPTGRFTNGKIVPDFLCERIGLPFSPPYLAPTTKGPALLKGVNYASAASGILRSTGYTFIGRVDLDTQLEWFSKNIQDLAKMLGASRTQELLSQSLFTIITGSNDFINNYLLKTSPLAQQYSPEDFQEVLINKLSSQLQQMYKLGARKVLISSIGPIGCIPNQLAKTKSPNGTCSDIGNNLALGFNQRLNSLIQNLNGQLAGASFVVIDAFAPVLALCNNPSQYGFKYGAKACCGAGLYKGQVVCLPIITPCSKRKDYVFWDPYHPTERANSLLADVFYQQLLSLI